MVAKCVLQKVGEVKVQFSETSWLPSSSYLKVANVCATGLLRLPLYLAVLLWDVSFYIQTIARMDYLAGTASILRWPSISLVAAASGVWSMILVTTSHSVCRGVPDKKVILRGRRILYFMLPFTYASSQFKVREMSTSN
jgi:ABC-type multidrug transport system permease subunit